jgi:NAD(P)-dependent dehydrogenase (short-subunit alcohol dehydrogenase family)
MTKIALITGGSRGLGRSMALHLAEQGRDIILTYNNRDDEAAAVVQLIKEKKRKAVALKLDVSRSDRFASFVDSVRGALKETWNCSTFDFLINNAGIGRTGEFSKVEEADFDLLMNIHLKAPFFLSQKLLPLINDGGRILNISSGLARFTLPGFAAYATMKGGVEVLTRYMAKELGPRGISVNVVAPGAIETDFGGGMVRDNKEVNQFIAANTALGRVGLPDDIGGAVAMLLADESGWINGQRIEVSGGQSI